jgi:aminoglycoside/choline kinase family phosphotransferase
MNQSTRSKEIHLFLKNCNLSQYDLLALKQDASHRKYFRLVNDNKSLILMDCPPSSDSVIPFITATKFLSKHNFSVPNIYYQNVKQGLLILEDFGDNSFNNYLQKHPKKTDIIYKLALDNLIKLSQQKSTEDFPIHSKDELIRGIKTFNKYFLNINNNKFEELSNKLFTQLNYQEKHLSFRDFHADNLIYLTNRNDYMQIGLLDYQDISHGFISYDLLSLIQDARRFIPLRLQKELLNYFLKNLKYQDKSYFLKEYSILSFQRNCRIIGLFNKFYIDNNNSSYLKYLDNIFKNLKNNLENEYLREVRDYLISNSIKIRKIVE